MVSNRSQVMKNRTPSPSLASDAPSIEPDDSRIYLKIENGFSSGEKGSLCWGFVVDNFNRLTYFPLLKSPKVRHLWLRAELERCEMTYNALFGHNEEYLNKIYACETEKEELLAEIMGRVVNDDEMTDRGKLFVLKAIRSTRDEEGWVGIWAVWREDSEVPNQRVRALRRVIREEEGTLEGYKTCWHDSRDAWPLVGNLMRESDKKIMVAELDVNENNVWATTEDGEVYPMATEQEGQEYGYCYHAKEEEADAMATEQTMDNTNACYLLEDDEADLRACEQESHGSNFCFHTDQEEADTMATDQVMEGFNALHFPEDE